MSHGSMINNVYVKNENENQKLRMSGGSWSVNLDDLPKGAEYIEYITPQAHYKVKVDEAFTHGFVRQLGGERKLVVPLKYWVVT